MSVGVATSKFGSGVFAKRDFTAEDIIGQVSGIILTQLDYESDFCIDLGGGLTLEPTSPFRFLNHSCHANCELFQWASTEPAGGHPNVWIQATRPIKTGEELTIDYAWPAGAAIRCDCGSASCRGWIVESSQLHLLLLSQTAGERLSGNTMPT